jgi:hypothetical protein
MPRRRLNQIAVAAVILCFSGAVVEQIGRYRDRTRFEQIGKSVSIGRRTLNIFCSGQGAPVVIFDTYGHQSGYAWSSVQREVAKHTQPVGMTVRATAGARQARYRGRFKRSLRTCMICCVGRGLILRLFSSVQAIRPLIFASITALIRAKSRVLFS